MKTDIKVEVDRLAADPRISDYDFWRSLKNVDNEIFHIANNNEPIPFDMIRWRSILKRARLKRGHTQLRTGSELSEFLRRLRLME